MRRDILWGRTGTQFLQDRKLHLISWEKICRAKNQRGLGLVPIRTKNLALLGKWYFKWENERNRLWCKWIKSKYKYDDLLSLSEIQVKGHVSDSLRAIKKVSNHQILKDKISRINFSWKLHNGETIRFWEDNWLGNSPLRDTYKRIYNLTTLKDQSVVEVIGIWQGREGFLDQDLWTRKLRP